MQDKELCQWLALYHTPGLGPCLYVSLLRRCGTPEDVLELAADPVASGISAELHALLNAAAAPGAEIQARIDADIIWLQNSTHHLVTYNDDDYPPLLKQIDCAPPLFYLSGNRLALRVPQIAVVGSRSCSVYGRETAHWLATGLCSAGLGICSGLAKGVDTAAHSAAVSAHGHTLAVLGSGLQRIYPAANSRLAEVIAERGAMVSEFPLDAPPRSEHFPRRNRLISGMSLGVLVVEATLRSGSLITARLAMEQNREVFAVPGSLRNPQSRGCHRLLREGANLVETVDDVLQQLQPALEYQLSLQATTPAPERSGAGDGKPGRRKPAVGEHPGTVTELLADASALHQSAPLTPAGKSERTRLMQPAVAGPAAGAGGVRPRTGLGSKLNREEKQVLHELETEAVALDVLVQRTGLNVSQLSAILLALELKQRVSMVPGGYKLACRTVLS